MQTSKCHQIPCHPHKNHGGLHIVMEWGNFSRSVGLQQNTPMDNQTLLWQGGWIWKGQHDLFLLGKIR